MAAPQDVDLPFLEAAAGDKAAADRLFAQLYEELRQVAGRQIWGKRRNLTLGPTAAVNMLYEKWIKRGSIAGTNRSEFPIAAARAIQHIVIDHHRAKKVRERERISGLPGEHLPASSGDANSTIDEEAAELALEALRLENPRDYRAAVRHYDGMLVQAIAEVLGLSAKQVQRDLRASEAFVQNYLVRRNSRE